MVPIKLVASTVPALPIVPQAFDKAVINCQLGAEGMPLLMYKPAVPSVWYTSSPVAGLTIAPSCACVILGTNNPFTVDFISSIALASAALPSLLTLTDCAFAVETNTANKIKKAFSFFILVKFVINIQFFIT